MVTKPTPGDEVWWPEMAAALDQLEQDRIDGDTDLQVEIDALALGASGYFRPETYGAVGDGTTDDTTALRDCITAAMAVSGTILLSAKTYAISGELQFLGVDSSVNLIGMGQEASIIKAIHANARLSWGETPVGTGWTGLTLYGRPSVNSGWRFDGNLIATRGVMIGAPVGYSNWHSISVIKCNGDGFSLYGTQNSVFSVVSSEGHSGHGFVIDYGCANCDFIACQSLSNDGYDFDVRQSGGLGWGTASQPQFLNFLNCQTETPGSPYFADTGLGGIRLKSATYVTIERCTLSTSTAGGHSSVKGSVVLEPSPWVGGATGWVTFRDSYADTIYLNANSGGVAQAMGGGNEPLFLEGLNTIVNLKNGSTGYVVDHSRAAGSITYTAEGTGAAAYLLHARRAKTANDPLGVWYNSAGSGLAQIDKDGNIYARNGQSTQAIIGNVGGFAGLQLGGDATILRSGAAELFANRIIHQGTASTVPVRARAAASQTANLFQVENSAGSSALWSLDKDGIPRWDASGNQQTTVGAAGGAAALPATPTKYLKVKDSAGTTYVIPAYAAS